jgi:bifunctional non-homologous end joining protein LigD
VGRVRSGFTELQLKDLYARLKQHEVATPVFSTLPAEGYSRWNRGLSEAEMKSCTWVKPAIICQIKFTERTQENYLLNAVYLGLREDKSPKDIVREE